MSCRTLRLGARLLDERRCAFCVWAPRADRVDVVLRGESECVIEMQREERDYFVAVVDETSAGTRYMYRLNGKIDRPDPASRYQPEGVHGPSEVVHAEGDWTDEVWRGVSLDRAIFYEVHVGAYTAEGTFDALVKHLDRLRDLGVTIVELMPVAQFPGSRNWGYDGVAPFAVQNSYGGPAGLRRLVNACHERGMGVAIDVVYNHLGPEGNYLEEFGPYFTQRYGTPWGKALNFDGAWSDEVRRYFVESALMWIEEYHIDALRLDAVHAIFDQSAYPFLHELGDAVHHRAEEMGRRVLVIAESDLNDPRLVRSDAVGGWGLDAAWSDDLHHALHAMLTGERDGYYSDFGSLRQVAKALRDGYVYAGDYSTHRSCRHGAAAPDVPPKRHVVCWQNHDQVGNRMKGDRLSTILLFEQMKVAAAVILLSPFTPLLFMGEEYGETVPFQYFVSHGDADLVEAVRKGRAKEFASFAWEGEVPDPQAEETFLRSRLNHALRESDQGRALEQLYRVLIRIRTSRPAVCAQDRTVQEVTYNESRGVVHVWRADGASGDQIVLLVNCSSDAQAMDMPQCGSNWVKLIDTADARWNGPGAAARDAAEPLSQVNIGATSAVLYGIEEKRA